MKFMIPIPGFGEISFEASRETPKASFIDQYQAIEKGLETSAVTRLAENLGLWKISLHERRFGSLESRSKLRRHGGLGGSGSWRAGASSDATGNHEIDCEVPKGLKPAGAWVVLEPIMTFPTNPPPPGQPRQLNLQQMAEQFMAGMQRHFDMLTFNLVSRAGASEAAYAEQAKAVGLVPILALHRNFEQTQAQARDLLHAQIINDSLNLAIHCLHNAHVFLAVIRANQEHPSDQTAIQESVNSAQQQFMRAQMDEKFNQLESNYKVMCPLEDTILSMGFALQAFAQQQGIIREGQLDDSGELPFELKRGQAGLPLSDLSRPGADVETFSKVFREGERLAFDDAELQSLLLTVTVFGQELFQAVANYARDNRPPQAQ